MNTHTIILKCKGNKMPDLSRLESCFDAIMENPQIEYFGRNGRRLYSNPKAIMESLNGKFFLQFSFRHLLQLDSVHAFAIIKSALKNKMVRKISNEGDALEVILP
ncbi:hypothetical protein [Flavobacterium sp.]|uniref:hypothetical protein n=1 Tax=Flavobacterium sp. TaxID=239 RepID=UPI0012039D1C|nr:hypothetical protein [Flavobacterium sp.]RZJ71599.1 MAG: hypothetical protein EOO49_09580 [Flavobacterium sp.]